MRRVHAPITLVVAALALGGCTAAGKTSAGNFKGDEQAVATVVDNLQKAARQGQNEKVCNDVFTKELAAKFNAGGATCAGEIKDAIRDVNDYNLKVTDVNVTGTTATATVTQDKEHKTSTFGFQKVGPDWRLSSLSG
jgi:hypothetical protein